MSNSDMFDVHLSHATIIKLMESETGEPWEIDAGHAPIEKSRLNGGYLTPHVTIELWDVFTEAGITSADIHRAAEMGVRLFLANVSPAVRLAIPTMKARAMDGVWPELFVGETYRLQSTIEAMHSLDVDGVSTGYQETVESGTLVTYVRTGTLDGWDYFVFRTNRSDCPYTHKRRVEDKSHLFGPVI